MKRRAMLSWCCILPLVVSGVAGCALDRPWRGRQQRSAFDRGLGGSGSAETAAAMFARRPDNRGVVRVVDLAVDIARIDLPEDKPHHSLKIWNHVDQLRIDPEAATRLARNGLRIGVAGPDAWAPIRAIFSAAEAEVRRDSLVLPRGAPLSVELDTITGDQSIFRYDRAGKLVGETFSAGKKMLTVDYVYHTRLGGASDLTIQFEIVADRGAMRWQRRPGGIRQVRDIDRHRFDELTTAVTLNRGEFVVIGLTERATSDYLIGRRFLGALRSGIPYETVLCLTPKPLSRPALTAVSP